MMPRTGPTFPVDVGGLPNTRPIRLDKHPSYDILNGPSGTGVDDLFTPENDAEGAGTQAA
jgi:hypothetical protein